ncbi:putative RNA-binding protein [Helianthus annuus]|nr:putative RNA-binding protein [Helianthus annuus]
MVLNVCAYYESFSCLWFVWPNLRYGNRHRVGWPIRFVPLDDEDCEPYTDVYWIKFHQVHNARFAKRKLDESVFIGNRIQVSYAPQYESLDDTKEKLEGRRKEVVARLNRKLFSN